MPIVNSGMQTQSRGPVFTADRRLFLDADGKVVEDKDPRRVSLLVGVNGTLPLARAQELGIVDEEGKAIAAPPENKAITQRRTK